MDIELGLDRNNWYIATGRRPYDRSTLYVRVLCRQRNQLEHQKIKKITINIINLPLLIGLKFLYLRYSLHYLCGVRRSQPLRGCGLKRKSIQNFVSRKAVD